MSAKSFAIGVVTLSWAGLSGCPGPLVEEDAALTQFACTQPRPYPPALNCDDVGYASRQHQVCVNFDNNGCIDKNNPVTPETVYACPNDTIKWEASGAYSGAKNFAVWFIPIRTGTANRPVQERTRTSHGPWKVLRGAPRGKAADGMPVEYKYTVVGGRDACTDRVFDPRIKIDPQ